MFGRRARLWLVPIVATTIPTGAHNIGAGAAQPEAKLAARRYVERNSLDHEDLN
jgi:hypothetical protein